MRIIYINPGPVLPPLDETADKFYHLSKFIEGDVLHPAWGKERQQDYCNEPGGRRRVGRFTYHFVYTSGMFRPLQILLDIFFYVTRGLAIARTGEKVDAVVCYGTNKTGIGGLLLSKLLGVPLIAEISGNPAKGILLGEENPSWGMRVKAAFSVRWAKFVVRECCGLKLLYPEQADVVDPQAKVLRAVFHDFVPTRTIAATEEDDGYILHLGFPWHLKGVDLLIPAFKQIADRHPDVKLKVVGYCPDWAPYEKLIGGHPAIELCKPVEPEQAHRLVERARCLVLASRTESMGRVLLEAWAASKPVVASRVDGIPRYVEHEVNGLLFESENIDDLARQLDRVLSDDILRRELGRSGLKILRSKLNEEVFARSYAELVQRVMPAVKI